jgi:TRAP-type C4-dicarboxylate transport system substrate-binding protein
MKRILAAILILFCSVFAWQMFSSIKLKVVGQPSSTGLIATELEQPFFLTLKSNTELPIDVDFKTLDQIGVKDTYQLPMMKDGVFDLVSLRLVQNVQHEITLNGLDVTGLNINFEKLHALANAYAPIVDQNLQEKYKVKLLGLWTFGPQELYCSKPIHRLSDLKGLKVRVQSEPTVNFMKPLGVIPAIIPFEETLSALKSNLIDCATTSLGSAASAGWLDYVQYYVPIGIGSGVNGYVMALSKWDLLNQEQQDTLQKAFDTHLNKMWQFSENLYLEQQNCVVGKDTCKRKKYNLVKVELPKEDFVLIDHLVKTISLKNWFELCNKEYPQCEAEWLRLAAPLANLD